MNTAPRNIVILFDGTGNELGRNLSNVLKLYRICRKDDAQLCFYDPGVGTIGRIDPWRRLQQRLVELLGLVAGYGLDDNVLDAYRFLVANWREGDRLFLFGYSRGAWTARVFAGLLYMIGLVAPQQLNMADAALGAYKQSAMEGDFGFAGHFARVIGVRRVAVHFIGAWDTVASVLVPRPDRFCLPSLETLPYTKANPGVAIFRHALALDERRKMYRFADWSQPQRFKPEPGEPGEGAPQDIEQVWFPGAHSDIGGGKPEDEAGLSKLALAWMAQEAGKAGLAIDQEMYDHLVLGAPRPGSSHSYVPPDPMGPMHRSILDGICLLAEPRRVPQGHRIDVSVRQRMAHDTSYRPPNLPPE